MTSARRSALPATLAMASWFLLTAAMATSCGDPADVVEASTDSDAFQSKARPPADQRGGDRKPGPLQGDLLDPGPTPAKQVPVEATDRVICRLEIAPAGGCPGVHGWTGSPLFGGGPAATLPEALARMCVYTPATPGASWTGPTELRCAPDRNVVVPLVSTQTVVGEWLAEGFDGGVGQLTAPLTASQPAAVRLAVLDAFASRADLRPTEEPRLHADPRDRPAIDAAPATFHGARVERIARQTLTTASGLPAVEVEVTTRTAMSGHDPASGSGPYGSLSELAQAIVAEVDDWREAAAVPGQPSTRHLVLNLSLGWHPEHGGVAVGDVAGGHSNDDLRRAAVSQDPAVESVFRALRYANCHGVVTFAAAGNDTGDDTRGPLLPAAWASDHYSAFGLYDVVTKQHLKELASCDAFVRGTPPNLGADAERPILVIPVGAVDATSHELVIARPDSRPPLMAFGDHVTPDDIGGAPMRPMTGTSAAVPIASATAAMLLATRIGDNPAPAHALLHAMTGDALMPLQSEDHVSSWYKQIGGFSFERSGRLLACEVLRAPCARPSPPSSIPSGLFPEPDDARCVSAMPADPATGQPQFAVVAPPADGDCTGIAAPTAADPDIAGALSPLVQPGVYPQPPTDRCPYCWVHSSAGNVWLDFSDTGTGWLRGLKLVAYERNAVKQLVPTGQAWIGNVDPAEPQWVYVGNGIAWDKAVQVRMVGYEAYPGVAPVNYVTLMTVQ